jgi:hypothetical protein
LLKPLWFYYKLTTYKYALLTENAELLCSGLEIA